MEYFVERKPYFSWGSEALDHENAIFAVVFKVFCRFFWRGTVRYNQASVGREGSGKAKSSMGDNLLADGRKGDPQLIC